MPLSQLANATLINQYVYQIAWDKLAVTLQVHDLNGMLFSPCPFHATHIV